MKKVLFTVFGCLIAVSSFASFGVEQANTASGTVADANCANGVSCTIFNNNANFIISSAGTIFLPATTTVITGANMTRNPVFVPAVAGSYTTDTAANITAAHPWLQIGQSIPITVSNGTAGTFTLVGGSGVVMGAGATVTTGIEREYKAIYMASGSYTVY